MRPSPTMPTRVLMPPAEHARVAEEADVRRHPVALAEAAHAGTERLDHAMELVAHRERGLAARERVRPTGRDHQRTVAVLLEIGAADAAEADAEQDLTAPRGWNRDVLDPHVAPAVPAGGFHRELSVVRATGIRPALTVTRPRLGRHRSRPRRQTITRPCRARTHARSPNHWPREPRRGRDNGRPAG